MNLLPYTILSSAISIDGYLDDTNEERLLLSHLVDFERVDAVRASCDGILVGAQTLRVDNPSLRIRSEALQNERVNADKPQNPARITLTSSGKLVSSHTFFKDSGEPIFVYCPSSIRIPVQETLRNTPAEIIPMGSAQVDLCALLVDLKRRGIHRLLIEGGQKVATAFLSAGLINELHVAVAPFFVGEPSAPRLVAPGLFPHDKNNRMHLQETKMVGDMAVLIYKLQTFNREPDS